MKNFIKRRNIKNDNSGFTLAEVLIYVIVFSLIAGALVSFVLTIFEIQTKNYVVQEVDANARLALEVISDRVRSASAVNAGTSVFDADPGILSLAMDDLGKNPTVLSLSADDGTLRIKEGAGSAVDLTSDKVKVTNLVFRDLSLPELRNNIMVEITLEYYNPSGDMEYKYIKSLHTAVTLRK